VTPWLSLGCGYRRTIDKHPGDGASAGQQHWDFGYDYEVVHSWMLGREANNPYYAKFPAKYARWSYAKRVVFYPCIFDGRVPVHVSIGTCAGNTATRHTAPRDMNNGSNYSAAVVHFLEYVDGACSSVGGEPSACVAPSKHGGGE
jgi:hypothetical protein